MVDDTVGRTPIEDGWEPEPERPGAWERVGGGPIAYFRAVPARGFAWLGGVVFVAGWAAAGYIAFAGNGSSFEEPTNYKVTRLMGVGLQATVAAGILWAVAAFLWVKVLPALPDDGTER